MVLPACTMLSAHFLAFTPNLPLNFFCFEVLCAEEHVDRGGIDAVLEVDIVLGETTWMCESEGETLRLSSRQNDESLSSTGG